MFPKVKLKEIAAPAKNSIADGPFGSNLKLTDYVETGIPVLQGKNITNNKFIWSDIRFISEKKAEELTRSRVFPGDILMIKIGSIGYAAIVDDLKNYPYAIIPANLAKITPDLNKIDSNFLYYFLSSKESKRKLISLSSKTAQPAISLAKIKEFDIPLPDLKTQQIIANLFEQADLARQKRRQANQLTEQFLQSAFLEMFGDPVKNEKGWDVKTLADVCIKISDGTHFSPPNAIKGEYKYITAKNIKKEGFNFKSLTYISEAAHKEIYRRCNPEFGDVLYIKDGVTTGIAMVNTLKEEFSLLSSVALFKLNKKINSQYLVNYLNSEAVYQSIRRSMGGAAITRLTVDKLKRIKVVVPPLPLQQKFAKLVECVEQLRAKQRQSEIELDNLFNSLLGKYFG